MLNSAKVITPGGREVPLSFLDLVPSPEDYSPAAVRRAIEASVKTAQTAEKVGYRRYLVAEHHNTPGVVSSATYLIMGQLAGQTSTIKIGSGGIMLPNHTNLQVAENLGTLEALYPGRIEAGLGRAPGTDPAAAAQLARQSAELHDIEQDIQDIQAYFAGRGVSTRYGSVQAYPGAGANVPMYVLGSSLGGATMAADLGLPFAFASHFAPDQLDQAIAHYRNNFRSKDGSEPYVMAGVNTMVADTKQEAEFQYTTLLQMFAAIATGRRGPIPAPTTDLNSVVPPMIAAHVSGMLRHSFVGEAAEVAERLGAWADQHEVDELITVTYAHDPAVRDHSVALLGQVQA